MFDYGSFPDSRVSGLVRGAGDVDVRFDALDCELYYTRRRCEGGGGRRVAVYS